MSCGCRAFLSTVLTHNLHGPKSPNTTERIIQKTVSNLTLQTLEWLALCLVFLKTPSMHRGPLQAGEQYYTLTRLLPLVMASAMPDLGKISWGNMKQCSLAPPAVQEGSLQRTSGCQVPIGSPELPGTAKPQLAVPGRAVASTAMQGTGDLIYSPLLSKSFQK